MTTCCWDYAPSRSFMKKLLRLIVCVFSRTAKSERKMLSEVKPEMRSRCEGKCTFDRAVLSVTSRCIEKCIAMCNEAIFSSSFYDWNVFMSSFVASTVHIAKTAIAMPSLTSRLFKHGHEPTQQLFVSASSLACHMHPSRARIEMITRNNEKFIAFSSTWTATHSECLIIAALECENIFLSINFGLNARGK